MLHDDWKRYLAGRAGELSEVASNPEQATGQVAGQVAWLTTWAALRFSGPDARTFLQGYLTSDTTGLSPDRLDPTAICNLKGRVVVNGWCCALDALDVRLLVHCSLVPRLTEFLRPYLMFAKTKMVDETPDLLIIGALQTTAGTGGLPLGDRHRIFLCDRLDTARRAWQQHIRIDEAAWQASLIEERLPLITAATAETFLPQMLGLDTMGAVSFTKGCYLGQEVVARAQHRGAVKRRLRSLVWDGDRQLEPGEEISDKTGRSVGIVVNATNDAGHGRCLAVMQTDDAEGFQQGDTELRGVS
jgi:folate-binding protein YgfZ